MKGQNSLLLLAGLLWGGAMPAAAQTPTSPPNPLLQGVSYAPEIPTPAEHLGHELGARPVLYSAFVEYLRRVAHLSDRVEIQTIGRSHEGRPMQLLAITAPENQARLEEIRLAHVARTQAGASGADASHPVVVWLGYGVHGAEAAGLESALPLVHHLAAGQGAEVERMLRESVVLVVAALNPDGHARRIDRQLSFASNVPVTNPDHAGHDLWAAQRANHYGFDLNRQWLLLTQPEPQAWLEAWHGWKPTVSADFHEMGTTSTRPTTYFFSPGSPGRDQPLTPPASLELLDRLTRFHTEALDREARLYFTQEAFDGYYIGTGSSYPLLYGSMGILFEVGTSHAGLIDTELGRRSLGDNIHLHFTSALTTVHGAVELKDELLAHQEGFFTESLAAGAADSRGAYVIHSPDRTRLAYFVDLLQRHQVDVYELAQDITVEGVEYPAGEAVVVPLAQGAYPMVRGIFDRVEDFAEPIFSDVNGWTLPLAFNLDHAPLGQQPSRGTGGNLGGVLGPLLGDPDFPTAPDPDRGSYGYIFEWTDHYAPRAVQRLLTAGLIVRAALGEVTVETTQGPVAFQPGAIFVPLDGQTASPDDIYGRVSEVAAREGIPVHGVTSGRTLEVAFDLGSGAGFGTLEAPEVLLLFDDGIQRFDMGHIWHLLDARMEMPVTLKEKSRILEIDWRRYTHIVLPGGPNVGLSTQATARLAQWIREDGGTLLALRQGAEWAEGAILGRTRGEEAGGEASPDAAESGPPRYDLAEFSSRESEHRVSGVIFASDLDITHPLGFGYQRRTVASHRDTAIRLVTPENPFATVARYLEPDPHLSGYASERRRREIGGTPMMVAERRGAGTVILMTDNPNFRGTYLGTNKLFMNGIFFSKLFSAPSNPSGAGFRR